MNMEQQELQRTEKSTRSLAGWCALVALGFSFSAYPVAAFVDESAIPEELEFNSTYDDLVPYFADGETVLEDGDYLWRSNTWSEFEAKAQELGAQSLRLIDVEIDMEDGEAHYAGVWRTGTGSFALWTCPTWDAFSATWQELAMQGLQLIDLEVYVDQDTTMYFGVFREDMNEKHLWKDRDWNEISR